MTHYRYIYICVYTYTYSCQKEKFIENKVLNIVDVEVVKKLKFHLLLNGVTLCLTYALDGNDPQICLRIIVVNDACETRSHTMQK